MHKIIKKEYLQDNIIRITLEDNIIYKNYAPGQFAIIRATIDSERIPLTIYTCDSKSITFIFQVVGASTYILSTLNENDYVLDVCGPLGNKTPIDNINNAIVIGGGVGSAIAYPIAKALKEKDIDVTTILGFRNKDLIILDSDFKDVSYDLHILTDDGSNGNKGLVTDCLKKLIENKKYDVVYAIGPLSMMKYVSIATKEKNIKTIVSLNPIMIDGTGMCGGCRVKVDGKVKFACVDGPDFDGHLVDFEETIKRNEMYKDIEMKKYEDLKRHSCNLFKGIKDETKKN